MLLRGFLLWVALPAIALLVVSGIAEIIGSQTPLAVDELLGLGFLVLVGAGIYYYARRGPKKPLPESPTHTRRYRRGYVHYLGEFTKLFFAFLAILSAFGSVYSAFVGRWGDAVWSFAVAAVISWLLWVKKLPGAG